MSEIEYGEAEDVKSQTNTHTTEYEVKGAGGRGRKELLGGWKEAWTAGNC
jgi:hypothetical protein